jgi:hypothetical protein
MKKYRVSYNEASMRTLIVNAESKEEAERMVLDGDEDIDYDDSTEDDSTIVCINSCDEVEQ